MAVSWVNQDFRRFPGPSGVERVLHTKQARRRRYGRPRTGPAGTVKLVGSLKGSDSSPPAAPAAGELRDSTLKIVIVDESPIRSAILQDGLRKAGFMHVERIGDTN